MELLVVGAGEMGRWLADTLAPRLDSVAFADRTAGAAEAAAREQTAVDSRAVALETGDAFDVVALAVPIPAVGGAVRSHAPNATGALVDVTGAMAPALTAMERHAVSEYASFHPLFAPPRAPGRVAYVPGEAGETVGRVRSGLGAAGNEVFETTAADHDEAMETVQAKAHAAVLAYALAGESVDERFHTPVSSSLSELVETVTEGDARVYEDVQETFGGADEVAQAAATVAETVGDGESFASVFERARDHVGGVTPRDATLDGGTVDGDEGAPDETVPDETDGNGGEGS
ncbi:prephenate dehydrogenase [Halobaculum sp. MBLA0143]|uniref:prephenate dehydrogenase n=1 Tax=Halobaculum sp. MBLA0143 TaxID=3079933 RepID=UPI0035242EE2